jgi:hypothetical protein
MIKRALALLLFLASPALATPVEVTSGEHDGFTRIVLNFGAQTDWQFGRVVDGYRFRPIGTNADYDLRAVFQRIGQSRLAAISANESTSELDIGFACACHAIPFEFRPGIVVIDLRDGPPPKGSSFEDLLADLPIPDSTDFATGAALINPLDLPPAPEPPKLAAPYNWTDRFAQIEENTALTAANTFAPQPSSVPNLQPLRDQLLRQLSRGASEGVVDLALPQTNAEIPKKTEVEAARVALGALEGVSTKTVRTPDQSIGSEGEICITNADLDVMNWGGEAGAADQLATDMTALVGEFDQPEAEAVTRAVRARINLGFGVEARQILQAFRGASPQEASLMGMSYIVDGDVDPTERFSGQGQCNTAAALWAALSDREISSLSQIDSKAVVLAFSALPDTLRRHLGPSLIDVFLNLQDQATATTLRNIVLRASNDVTSEIAVMEAKIDIAAGDPAAAETHLDDATTGATTSSAKALMARVQARIDQNLPVDKETVTALTALQSEMAKSDIGPELATALVHAQAASGDFASAFAGLADLPAEAATVWKLLANLADDSSFLTYAAAHPAEMAGIAQETILAIAQRLAMLGMADSALNWMQIGNQTQGPLLARIHIARQDGRAALQALEGDLSAQAEDLRGQALGLLGDYPAAAEIFAPLSEPAQVQALARAQDWQSLAELPQSEWSALAKNLLESETPTPEVDSFGPLARGLALAEKSAATRAEIEELLTAVAAPAE